METARTFAIILVELTALFVVILTGISLLQRRLGEDRIRRLLSSPNRGVGLLKGAALGAVTPFCSCSTIPIVLGLVRSGVRFGTVAAFLLASPLLNPIIVGSIGVLFGWRVAFGYATVAFATTIALAALWEIAGLERYVKRLKVARPTTAPGPADPVAPSFATSAPGAGAVATEVEAPAWHGLRGELPSAFREALGALRSMVVPLLVGVSVGAMIYGFVPDAWLQTVLGPQNAWAVPIAAVIGIPLYVRAEVALPVGLGLVASGVGLGPVFALIIGGAGASVPEVSMLSAMFKPRLVATFVSSVIGVAIVGGLLIPMFV